MQDSIFTLIIKGEVPCHKIYEDERTFAFLDIHPIQPGQVVVVPKRQVPSVWDLDEQDYQALMAAGKRIARRMREVYAEKTHIALHVEGLDVAHAHLKVFPFSTDTEFHHVPDATAEPDHEALSVIAKKLAL